MKKAFKSLGEIFSKDPAGLYTFLVSNLAVLVLICLPVMLVSFGKEPAVMALFARPSPSYLGNVLGSFGLTIFLLFMYGIFAVPIQFGFFIGLANSGNAKEGWRKCTGNYGRLLGITMLRLVSYFAASSTIGFLVYIIFIIPFALLVVGGGIGGSWAYEIILILIVLLVSCVVIFFIDVTIVLCLFDSVCTKDTVVNIIEKTIKHGQVARFPIFLIFCLTSFVLWGTVILAFSFLYNLFFVPVLVVIASMLIFPLLIVGLSQPFYLDYRKVVENLTIAPVQPATTVDVSPPTP